MDLEKYFEKLNIEKIGYYSGFGLDAMGQIGTELFKATWKCKICDEIINGKDLTSAGSENDEWITKIAIRHLVDKHN